MIKSLYNILFALFMLLPATAAAQQPVLARITGKVKDMASPQTINNADVILTAEKGKIIQTTRTDQTGGFVLGNIPTGKYILIVTFENYSTERFPIALSKDTLLPDVLLHKKEYDLKEVTVNSNQLKIERKFDKTIIDVNNTVFTNSGTSFDLLQKMPSVMLQQDGILLLQGKLATVMIDGRPLNISGDELKNYLGSLPANTISKVELIKNPSMMHDAQASAIINIITNKSRSAGWNGTLSLSATQGHFTRYAPSLDLNYKKNKVNLFGTYSFSRVKERTSSFSDRPLDTHQPPEMIDIGSENINRTRNHNIKVGMDYAATKNSLLGITFYSTISNLQQQQDNDTRFNKAAVTDSLVKMNMHTGANSFNPSVNVYYKVTVDTVRRSELIVNLDYWRFDRHLNQDFQNSFFNNIGNKYADDLLLRSDMPGINNIYSLKADYTHPLKNSKILMGFKLYKADRDNQYTWQTQHNNDWKIDSSVTNQFLFTENINAFYGGYEHSWKKISMQLMLRAEHTHINGNSVAIHQQFKKDYLDLFPSVNLEYTPSQVHQFNLSYRKSINRPTYNYMDPFRQFQNQFNYTIGNPDLYPAIVGSVEAGHSFKNKLFTTISYTWTKNAVSSLYLKNDQDNALITTYDNLSATRSWELDMSYSGAITSKWTTSISSVLTYNYINTDFRNAPVKNEGWGFNLFLFNNISLPHQFSTSVVVAYSAPYRGTIFQYSGSGFASLGFSKSLLKNRLNVNLSLSDQLTHVSFQYKTNYNNLQYQQRLFRDNRTISLTLRYKLGNQKLKQASNRKTGIETEKTRMENK
ncbi:outer membrane receptor protein involved in Fe transport [Chitinophaga dinghuensis]|uniref:Outer membrane receptor protein involved in Fe transport n=1 Tax=Chitinophaga dinghuensis TaxID=1539050 RepID=A0A327W2F9_9BACT|nr:outer membrane beta-barrel family protein [Chitinophaga dinghuensis]RAJ83461.1 outer membrane receptor protein involved in Fe transport [Chitinophaga dinghuensis]